jgi:hypothetical protein
VINWERFPDEAVAAVNELACELDREPFDQDAALRAGVRFVLAAVGDRQRLSGRRVSELHARLQGLLAVGQGERHVG